MRSFWSGVMRIDILNEKCKVQSEKCKLVLSGIEGIEEMTLRAENFLSGSQGEAFRSGY